MRRTESTNIRTGELRRDLGRVARLLAAARRVHSAAPEWGAVAFQIARAEAELGLLEFAAFELLSAAPSPSAHLKKSIDTHVDLAGEALAAVGLEFRGDTTVLTPAVLECQPRSPLFATCEDESYAVALCATVRDALSSRGDSVLPSRVIIEGTRDEWDMPYARARKAGKFDSSGLVRRPWSSSGVAFGLPGSNTPPLWWTRTGWI